MATMKSIQIIREHNERNRELISRGSKKICSAILAAKAAIVTNNNQFHATITRG